MFAAYPAFIGAGEQFAFVEGDSALQPVQAFCCLFGTRRILQQAFKLNDIGGNGVGIEADGGAVCLHDRSGFGSRRFQQVPQKREQGAEAGASGAEFAFGPEEFNEGFTRVRLLAIKGEIGEERSGLLRGEASNTLFLLARR